MGKSIQLTLAEQLELRNKSRAELLRLEEIFENEDIKAEIDDFKDEFSKCEIVYKVILSEHQYKKTEKRSERLKIDMRQVEHALKFAGYNFERTLLNNLFGSEERRGRMSVKKLRDSLNHSIPPASLEELQTRKEELYGYMNVFLETIRNADAA